MKARARNKARSEARAKAFLKQVNPKKERNMTKAYMALKSSERSGRRGSGNK